MKLTLLTVSVGVAALQVPTHHVERGFPTVEARDLPTIQGVIKEMGDGLNKLNSAVKMAKGSDKESIKAVQTSSDNLIKSIDMGTKKIADSGPITLQEGIQLQSQVSGLQTTGQELIDGLIAKKPDVQMAGKCGVTRKGLASVKEKSMTLVKTVIGKLPESAQSLASSVSSGFSDSIAKVVAEFEPGKCVDKVSGGSRSGSDDDDSDHGSSGSGSGSSHSGSGHGRANGTTSSPPTKSTPMPGTPSHTPFNGTATRVGTAAAPAAAFALAVAYAML